MKRPFIFLLTFFIGFVLSAQEANFTVGIDAQQTGKTQLSVFNTLQKSVQEFLNNTEWTKRTLPQEQRVNASFFITVKSYSSDNFVASIQVQSSRPVYGSTMVTPIFNFKDDRFNFEYREHQPLSFNRNSFENNLVSTLSFYVYVILGMDADTFSPNGGADFYAQADQVASIAQQGGSVGWNSGSGQNSRYELNRQLTSSNFKAYHDALYQYHRLGLDMMQESLEEGKKNIAEAILKLSELQQIQNSGLLIHSFFDAKAAEIADVFSDGPHVDVDMQEMVNQLNNMAPTYNQYWSKI